MVRLLLCILTIITLQPLRAQGNVDFNEYVRRQNNRFNNYVKQQNDKFNAFLDSLNRDYAKHLAGEWKSVRHSGRVKYEKDKEVKPIIREEKEDENKKDRIIQGDIISVVRNQKAQPTPIVPIEENRLAEDYHAFTYYGTSMNVRWGNAKFLKFSTVSNKEVAKAYEMFSKEEYKNLLSDCLKLRDNYRLCDWAYYKMLETLSVAIYGKGTNEATFLLGALFGKSGYKMRFAIDKTNKKLHLLCAMNCGAYDYSYYIIGGESFYLLDKSKPNSLDYCPKAYAGERELSLDINRLPVLKKNLSEERTIRSRSSSLQTKTRMNKNLIEFFKDYPTGYKNNNFMTRWAYYAETPVSEEIKNVLYPQLRQKIQNLPPLAAANMLLNWMQPLPDDEANRPENKDVGLHYGYDDAIWGADRAFFAEESLFYPLSDCEDHAILFSHLIRDLMGLDVALVYYPGHLSTAICFNTEVKGDAVMVGNRKFIVADPTSRGKVGTTMFQYRDTNPKDIKVILLKK